MAETDKDPVDLSSSARSRDGRGRGRGVLKPVPWTTLLALGAVVLGLVWLALVVVGRLSPDLVMRPDLVERARDLSATQDPYRDQHQLQIGVYALLEEYVNWFIQKDYLSFIFNVGSATLMFAFGVYVYLQSLLTPTEQSENAISLSWGEKGRLRIHTRSLGIFTIFTSASVLLVVNLSNEPNVEGFRSLVERLQTPAEMAKAYQTMLDIRATTAEKLASDQAEAVRPAPVMPTTPGEVPKAAPAAKVDLSSSLKAFGNRQAEAP